MGVENDKHNVLARRTCGECSNQTCLCMLENDYLLHSLFIVVYCCVFFVQIDWENRLKGDIGRDCLISVDGTDFRIQQQKGSYKYWFGYKFKAPGFRYEVGISIMCGDIVWMNGSTHVGLIRISKYFG